MSAFFEYFLHRQKKQGENSQAPSVKNNGVDTRLPFPKGVTTRVAVRSKAEKKWEGQTVSLWIKYVRKETRKPVQRMIEFSVQPMPVPIFIP